MRILVVDDEPIIVYTLAVIFRAQGFEVDTATSADAALLLAHAHRPDLVLCDIDMPGRDGIALMADLDRDLPGCPVLVLTGAYSSLERVRESSRRLQQPVNICTKPCRPVDLLRTADALLHLPRSA